MAAWATVVAVAVGFLLMRAVDDGPWRHPAVEQRAVAAAEPAPAAAPAPRTTVKPVDSPREVAMVAPPPPVTAGEAPYDMRPAWQRFAVPPLPGLGKKPVIAIVIDDVGLAKHEMEDLLELDAPVTISIMGYADGTEEFAKRARAKGDELLVHIPMEPQGNADPGPKALTVGLSPTEILNRLRWQLDRHEGFVGINNHMGSRFTSDAAGMKIVADELKARGLLFLDSRTAATSIGEDVAKAAGIPTASRDVFLDNEIGANAIDAQLALAERHARDKGSAIAIGHPHAMTIEALARFIPQAKARGIAFVPVSVVIARRDGLTIDYEPRYDAVSAAGSGKRSGSLPPPRG
ncbi:divergent polysaccharide deacetylase family protein [Zavarzinia sp.]|uniref:divergent polysaccharide deacetylase family protein n=1 Tax=Zavarzinia sp. TaxID=2027920 RepID=UPI003565C47E